ncbi:DUF305 domain-containing protein [Azospirillum sp. SYSU D00513]|uniref:DUF305 domain-containing protein n=1 Tax=Azospirillum sp. SYSU D00513 TaxID=2812561 RepID=UPI001A97C7B8|nr:DUF305 domain-containing protein [Azospirillum sp. SYSU D00513]
MNHTPTPDPRRPRPPFPSAGPLTAFLLLAAAGPLPAFAHDHSTAAAQGAPAVVSSTRSFQEQMAGIMDRMHAEMDALPATGDADRDFLRMMIPHHRAAVDMARVMLLDTRDPRIRNLALSIIAEQQNEIELMRAWLDQPPPPAPAAAMPSEQSHRHPKS